MTRDPKQQSIISQYLFSNYNTALPYHKYADGDKNKTVVINHLDKMSRAQSYDHSIEQHSEDEESKLHDDGDDIDTAEAETSTWRLPAPRSAACVRGTFEHTRKNERSIVKRALNIFVNSAKAKDVTLDQRLAILFNIRDEKIREAEGSGRYTMRTHPDRHAKGWSQRDDDLWIRTNFAQYLNYGPTARGSGVNTPAYATPARPARQVDRRGYNEDTEDEDDEEPDAPIKREPENERENTYSHTGIGAKKIPPAHLKMLEGKAVKRGFCLRKMLNEANGRPPYEGVEGRERTWEYRSGKLVIWPPLFDGKVEVAGKGAAVERADSALATERGLKRRAADDPGEEVKRIKVES